MKKLKFTSLILAVIMVVSMLPLGMVSAFAAGESSGDTVEIGTADEFLTFFSNFANATVDYSNKNVVLTADINMSGKTLSLPSSPTPFTGTFDGQGHRIYNLSKNFGNGCGLFGATLAAGTTATIKDLTLDVKIGKTVPTDLPLTTASTQTTKSGGTAALYSAVSGELNVENVTLKGSVYNAHAAGFVYKVNSGATVNFTNCIMSAKVYAEGSTQTAAGDGAGGFVCLNSGNTTITNCLMNGTVAMINETNVRLPVLGGFVAYQGSKSLYIKGSIVSGTVISYVTTVTNSSNWNSNLNYGVGGFVGTANATLTIQESMILQGAQIESKHIDAANVNQGHATAGFVGTIAKEKTVTVENCAMYGSVTANNRQAGGFFGRFIEASNATVTGCIAYGTYLTGQNTGTASHKQSACYLYGGEPGTAQYNIVSTTEMNGGTAKLGKNSLLAKPYWITAESGLYTLDSIVNKINGLYTGDNSDDWKTEMEGVEKQYKDNWTFSGIALPIPNACADTVLAANPYWYDNETANDSTDLVIHDACDLLAFAEAIKAKKNFAGMTVTLATNVVLNPGFDAFANEVTAPDVVWPLANSEGFAGTFDGNGKTISGIYYEVPVNQGYAGIFGNVTKGTAATVKNLAIVNSYVTASGSNAQGIGGIFGIVDVVSGETRTKATIDNVYAEINIQNKGADKHGSNGTGGFIGGVRTDAEITNSAFVGNVNGGGVRGAGGLIGTIATDSSKYLNTVTIENCYVNAAVTQNTTVDKEAWVGGLVGRVDHAVTTLNVTDVVSDCTVTGSAPSGKTATFGYLVGGANVTKSTSVTVGDVASNCTFNFENVTYVATTGNATEPVGKGGGKINGTASDFTGVAETAWATYGVTQAASAAELPALLYAWNLEMSVTLTEDLAMNFYADRVVKNSAVEAVFNDTTVTGEVLSDGTYKFSYKNILPQQIADEVIVKLGAITKTVTIKDYLVKLLDNEAAKQVAADLIRYAAAAQTYSEYNVENPIVDDELQAKLDTIAGSTVDAENIDAVDPDLTNLGTIAGAYLRLENALALVAVNAQGKVVAEVSVNAAEMDKAQTLKAEDGSTVEVSVAWYVKKALTGGVTETVTQEDLDLIEAIYAYGMSAAAYKNA